MLNSLLVGVIKLLQIHNTGLGISVDQSPGENFGRKLISGSGFYCNEQKYRCWDFVP